MRNKLVTIPLLVLLLSVLSVIAGVGNAFLSSKAHAAPKPGLWIEHTTIADGVRIRRVHDTFDGVICYVATNATANFAPSISCVPDRSQP